MRMAIGALMLAVPAIVQAAPSPEAAARSAIQAALLASAAGWNDGDLDRFMAIYSDDPSTSYVAAGERIIRDKPAIAQVYAPRFAPGAKPRGMLSFDVLDFRMLGYDRALLIARYKLTMPDNTIQHGPTSLVFRKEAGGWKIIADHSS